MLIHNTSDCRTYLCNTEMQPYLPKGNTTGHEPNENRLFICAITSLRLSSPNESDFYLKKILVSIISNFEMFIH